MSQLSTVIPLPRTQIREQSVTYFVISPEDLQGLIEKASDKEVLISHATAHKKYELSKEFLNDLANSGRINKYHVPGHPRVVRYSVKEIENLFK